ncbi:MAG: DNA gyrase subunit A, partial [Bacteroidetes bacterium]|nr:DNA gyrase subunit A [Bacteroidota bacterium]
FELRKAEERAHILEGLIIASDNIEEVIKIIRNAKSPDDAREQLMVRFELSDVQSRAIVDMRLRHLTGLEQDKLRAEFNELVILIADLKDILENEERRMQIIRDELNEVKDKFGDERRSRIEYSASEMRMEDLIADEEVVITISHAGYIKRTSLNEYKVQNRGGMGSKGSATRDKDFLEHLFVATNHNYLLIFTEKGRCFWMRVYEIPEGNKISKGRAIQNLINIEQDDKVKAYVKVQDLTDKEYVDNNFIMMVTKNGIIKKTSLAAYSRPRTNGINAIGIRDNDELLEAKLTDGNNEIVIATSMGRAIRFNESSVRPMGRNASGVRGVTLQGEKDEVVGMICVDDVYSTVMVVSEKGYGKRTYLNDPEDKEPIYRITNRGGKGVKTLNVSDKTGPILAIKNVTDEDDLMIITKAGITIRMHIESIRTLGRAAQGVRLINLKGNSAIAAIARVPKSDDEDEELEEGIEGGSEEGETGTDIETEDSVE